MNARIVKFICVVKDQREKRSFFERSDILKIFLQLLNEQKPVSLF